MKSILLAAVAAIALGGVSYAQDSNSLTGNNTANSGSTSTSGSNATGVGIGGGIQKTNVDSSSQSGAISG